MENQDNPFPVSAISLDGHRVRLRPITRDDYGFLWECRSHPEIMHLWTQGSTLPSFEQYVQQLDATLAGHTLTLLIIELRTTPESIGFVYAYDYNPFDKYVFWSVAIHPAYTNIGWGVEASLLFLNYLFTYFDLHKVCSDQYAFNQRSIRILLRSGAEEEGRFRAQRYYQGAYHDVIRLAGTRAQWEKTRQKQHKVFDPRPVRSAIADGVPPVSAAAHDVVSPGAFGE
ncbi:MAG TPA: GNAT family protein [Ktedonobacterales bacterium]|jgi:RimJ/RimL family protein N-acetyltransferase